jgi:ribose transport system ATP-binding protein
LNDSTDLSALALQARAVSKTFGGVRVLDSLDLDIAAGEVHALLGQNGSGKSTFIKILSGFHRPEAGASAYVRGLPLELGSSTSAYERGCRFVHQDLGLIDSISVLDNMFLRSGFPSRLGTVRGREAVRLARRALAELGADIDPRRELGSLRPIMKTIVAIGRALLTDENAPTRLLVFDEPTASLPTGEVDLLFRTIRRVSEMGIGVLYVTHRFSEVFDISNRVSVLRDGVRIATRETATLTRRELGQLVVGTEIDDALEQSAEPRLARVGVRPALSVGHLSGPLLDSVSFDMAAGEILGFVGLAGSGAETILGGIFGAVPGFTMQAWLNGEPIKHHTPRGLISKRVAYMPPNRQVAGAFVELSARENLTIAGLKSCSRFGTIRARAERRDAEEWSRRLDLRPAGDMELEFARFSGGNQQKLLFGKWLRTNPAVFLLDEPTQGVDVGAKAALHRRLRQAAGSGMAIAVSSTDLEELAGLCDRVMVLRDGRIVAELHGSRLTADRINGESLGIARSEATSK